MNFGNALTNLKMGKRVCRTGWNGRDMWLRLIKANDWHPVFGEEKSVMSCLPFILMKTADGGVVPWTASSTDVLSDDWEVTSD